MRLGTRDICSPNLNMEKNLSRIQHVVRDLQVKVSELESKNERLRSDNAKMKISIEQIKNTPEGSEGRRDLLKANQEVNELKGQLQSAHLRINNLQDKLERLVGEVNPEWNDDQECAICLEDKKPKEFIRFPCKHEICMPCYEALRRETCPFCRAKISQEKI